MLTGRFSMARRFEEGSFFGTPHLGHTFTETNVVDATDALRRRNLRRVG
jgi:hypothetical protein